MTVFSYTGNQQSFSSGLLEERGTFSYNESAVISFESEDYGLISDLVSYYDDFGDVTDSIVSRSQIFDYGTITIISASTPFGKLSISTEFADVSLVRNSVGGLTFLVSGKAKIYVLPIHIGSGRIRPFGYSESTRTAYQYGSGALFGFNGAAKSTTNTPPEAKLRIRVFGGAFDAFSRGNYSSTGLFSAFTGAGLSRVIITKSETNIFRFSGSAVEKNGESYVGSGSLFGFVGHAERVTYDYNESSVIRPEGLDYGFVADNYTSEDDFGLISEDPSPQKPWNKINYGFITETDNLFPFGKLKLSSNTGIVFSPRQTTTGTISVTGTARIFVLPIHIGTGKLNLFGDAEPKASLSQIGSGSLFGFIGTANSRAITEKTEVKKSDFKISGSAGQSITPAPHIGSGTLRPFTGAGLSRVIITKSETNIFRFSGSAVEKNGESYVGSGSLFGFVGHVEKVTFDYNESSVVTIDGLDYGFVADNHTSEDDYGFISEDPSPQKPWNKINYGFITETDNLFPFGKLKLSSNTGIVFSPRQTTTGTISVTGTARIFVLPIHIGTGKLNLFGDAEPKASLSQIGSGSLFGFIGTANSRAITEKTEVKKSDFKISGSAGQSITPAPHIGSGTLRPFTGAAEARASVQSTTGLFKFTGSAIEKNAESYFGSGSLFGFVGHAEKVTYDYNESSVVTIDGLDYGFVADNYTSEDDYGFISESTNYGQQKVNYGYITDNTNIFPYGRFRFSDDKAIIKASLSHVGSGRIFAFTGSSETKLSAQETTGLFKFLGSSQLKASLSHVGSGSLFAIVGGQESVTPEPQIGSGTLTIFGAAVERNTESYVGSGRAKVFSTPIPAYRSFGYNGSGNLQITRISSATIGFGLVHVGSGSLFAIVGGQESITQEPHIGSGTITLFGAATNIKNTESYVGSGSLFAFGTKTEVKSNAPSATGLFKFFGSSPQAITPAPHIGSGRIFAFTGAAESTSSSLVATGLFKFAGNAIEKNTESYVGTGSLFTFISSTESSAATKVSTGLFKFTGSAVEKNTESYFGSGRIFAFDSSTSVVAGRLRSDGVLFKLNGSSAVVSSLSEIGSGVFNLRQRVSGLDARSKQRYISGIERKTIVPPTDGALFRATGVVTLFFIYGEVGSGTITLAGNARTQTKPVHVGQGQLSINGSAETPRARPYIGTGSLFGLNSSVTVAASRPPVSGTLFRFTGSAVETNTESYTGSTETKLSGNANIIARLKHIGSGKTTIFGSAIEKNTESYVGSGRIFGFTGGAESVGRKLPEFKTLFRITGFGTVRNLYTHIGTGSLFTFVSKTETTSSAETKTTLFKFTGSAAERNTESYIGSGLVRFRTKDSILDINGKVIFVSAQESSTVVPPTSTTLFKFGGAAKTERNTNWTTTGTLFGFGGGAERVSFTPAISTTLFDFVGTAEERKSKSYAGSGSIFGFIGAAESSAVVSTTGGLFKITGSAKESVLPATYVGTGSLFAFVSKTESVTFSPPTTNLFKFTGNAVEKNTEAYFGTGRIFGFQSAGIARVVPYDRTQILFRLSGVSKETFGRAGYVGITQAQFNGISTNRYVEFDSPKPIRIYII